MSAANTVPISATARDLEVDLLVVGSGTGMASALAAHEAGLSVLIIEKTEYMGGSTALSGGAFWVPANSVLEEAGAADSQAKGQTYVDAVVGDTAPAERRAAYIEHGPAAIDMLRRLTPLQFMWAKGYSDYHPEEDGGTGLGRSVEAKPFDLRKHLGENRKYLRPTSLTAPVPMPITSVDYRWMNLMAKVPAQGVTRVFGRMLQGVGGMALGREYSSAGQALAGGMLAGVTSANIPFWTQTSLVELLTDEQGRVTGALVEQQGRKATVTAKRGVVLAAGGFDHNMVMRREHQSESLQNWSLGSPGNTGDAITVASQQVDAATTLMDQVWWFPAVAPHGDQGAGVMLAERSLPGSFIVGGDGRRFINESTDYMTFGAEWLRREKSGDGIGDMWIIFDQEYKNSYVFATSVFPRQPLPQSWYDAGIAVQADDPRSLARAAGLDEDAFDEQIRRFNDMAAGGIDHEFGRGQSMYDRYYGDPTVAPNPNLRPLKGKLYAVKLVPSDLGTCGGLSADARARVLRADGSVVEGLYAIGNTAGNAFGHSYPGAGATIGQGIVFGCIAALDAAGR